MNNKDDIDFDEDDAKALIELFDCPYGLGGDACSLDHSYKCDIKHSYKKCQYYINIREGRNQ